MTISISSVSSTTPTSPLSNVSAISGSLAASDPSAVTGTDTTKLSKMGDLMSQLQGLESSDPAKAKQVLSQIATTLKAQSGSDPKLASVAAKFDQAAQTGDLSVLQPNKSGGHHGGHHHHGGGGAPPSDPSATPSTATTSGKVASYQGSDPMAEVESAISSALAM